MTDTENVFDGFTLLDDDEELDMDKIFGSGSDESAPPPPAPEPAEEGHRGLQGRIPDTGGCARIQQGHLPHPRAGRADV